MSSPRVLATFMRSWGFSCAGEFNIYAPDLCSCMTGLRLYFRGCARLHHACAVRDRADAAAIPYVGGLTVMSDESSGCRIESLALAVAYACPCELS